MALLAIVVALAIQRWRGSLPRLQRDAWYAAWVRRVRGLGCGPGRVRWLLSVGAPVAALAAALHGYGHGLPGFAIDLLVLLYAFGRGDLRAHLARLRADLERGDLQAAFHDDAAFHRRPGSAETGPELDADIVEHLSYRHLDRHFAVIFWFLVAGAPGALLYRLAAIDLTLAAENPAETRVGARSLHWLEWLPVRLLGLGLAAAGNFRACRTVVVDYLFGAQTSAELLRAYVPAALTEAGIDGAPPPLDGAALIRIEALFFRALMYWLGAIALGVIFT